MNKKYLILSFLILFVSFYQQTNAFSQSSSNNDYIIVDITPNKNIQPLVDEVPEGFVAKDSSEWDSEKIAFKNTHTDEELLEMAIKEFGELTYLTPLWVRIKGTSGPVGSYRSLNGFAIINQFNNGIYNIYNSKMNVSECAYYAIEKNDKGYYAIVFFDINGKYYNSLPLRVSPNYIYFGLGI